MECQFYRQFPTGKFWEFSYLIPSFKPHLFNGLDYREIYSAKDGTSYGGVGWRRKVNFVVQPRVVKPTTYLLNYWLQP